MLTQRYFFCYFSKGDLPIWKLTYESPDWDCNPLCSDVIVSSDVRHDMTKVVDIYFERDMENPPDERLRKTLKKAEAITPQILVIM